jgi:hypothetical protein
MSDFRTRVLEDCVLVTHVPTGHRFSFARGPHLTLGIVTITPNHGSPVFASSVEDDAEDAALDALRRHTPAPKQN